MLKIEDMHVYYGAIHAIKGVSFEVGEGEIVALIGANGAGKSTILKTVSGLMHPRSGNISFCGEDIAHTDAYKLLRHGLAHVPEGRRVFSQLTVYENLKMGAYTRKDKNLSVGVSPRGTLALFKAAQITAAMGGRDYVIPEDIQREAVAVLAHRISAGVGSRLDCEKYIARIIEEVQVPIEEV